MTKRSHGEMTLEAIRNGIEAVEMALAPSGYREELRATAKALVASRKCLFSCDEEPHVLPTMMEVGYNPKIWSVQSDECTEEWRINYRELLFTTPGLSQYISGVILHEETVEQQMQATESSPKQTVPDVLSSLGIIPGVKVDRAFMKMMGSQETHTQGLDGLGERCKKYYSLGCRFANWRSPLHIGPGMPSETAVRIQCDSLARYASICQEHGLMPIVEPDVDMAGEHPIEVSAKVTKHVLMQTFASLDRHNVDIEGIVIRPNLVRPGEKSPETPTHIAGECPPALVGAATVKVFGTCLPSTLPGVALSNYGRNIAFITAGWDAINEDPHRKRLPWPLTYDIGRFLQRTAIVEWLGKAENRKKAQEALLERARVYSEDYCGRL